MAPFGENFRGNQTNVPCRLCGTHLDNQSMIFKCEELKVKVKIQIEDIYKPVIPLRVAQELLNITNARKMIIEEKTKLNPSAQSSSAAKIFSHNPVPTICRNL